ncbi:MAG: sulfatase [bacterium]
MMAPRFCLVLTLSLVLLGGCSGGEKAPNVLLITMDTTRADHLSAYGYKFKTSPFLEEFAAEGALFKRVYAAAPATAPSHATIFTSLSPLTHRVVKNAVALAGHHETLAEVLAGRGYQTAAIVSSFVLNRKFGLDQGFAHYDDRLDGAGASIAWKHWEGQEVDGAFDCRADATTDRALAWLETARDPDVPFFLFVHYFDPHDPYAPPREYQGRFSDADIGNPAIRRQIGAYDGEIAFTDDQMRRLCVRLGELGLAEDTIVIITGDHGEGLWQRGYQYHGAHIYEEAVRVPLAVRWPGRIPAGSVFQKPVTIAAVMPTLFDLLGVPTDGRLFHGRSLARALQTGEPLRQDLPVFLYRIPYDPHDEFGVWVDGEKHGVRLGNWKYLEAENEGTTELFDLRTDPGEMRNLAAADPDVAADMARILADWREVVTSPDSLTVRPALSDSDLKKLRSLGYVH